VKSAHELMAAAAECMKHGQGMQALCAAREAVMQYRALAQYSCRHTAVGAIHLSEWAAALDLLVSCLRAAGQRQEALEAAQECCHLKRELAAWGERLRPEALAECLAVTALSNSMPHSLARSGSR